MLQYMHWKSANATAVSIFISLSCCIHSQLPTCHVSAYWWRPQQAVNWVFEGRSKCIFRLHVDRGRDIIYALNVAFYRATLAYIGKNDNSHFSHHRFCKSANVGVLYETLNTFTTFRIWVHLFRICTAGMSFVYATHPQNVNAAYALIIPST